MRTLKKKNSREICVCVYECECEGSELDNKIWIKQMQTIDHSLNYLLKFQY